jgi:hypothetical protein
MRTGSAGIHSKSSKRRLAALALALVSALGVAGCKRDSALPASWNTSLTPATHRPFPVATGVHATDCNTCHGPFPTFTEFTCFGCHAHDQAPTDLGHQAVAGYAYTSAACYRCHADPGKTSVPSRMVWNPSQGVVVTALAPMYSGPSIASVTPQAETLEMGMDHLSPQLAAVDIANCAMCHDPASGSFFPGKLHSSLANAGLPQPTACAGCHAMSAPTGFVGPLATSPARAPASGEMKHDAVAWAGGAPGTTRLVTADCGACHASPSAAAAATWASGLGGSGQVQFHVPLGAAQPASCIDCHANSRPAGILDAAHAAVPAGLTFNHGDAAALGDCAGCHAGAAAQGTSWAGGKFHLAGSATPASCLPCHAGERPGTSAPAGWADPGYAAAPFDYGPNVMGTSHGAGQDCALCHAGPGSGAWGGTQNWQRGHFAHGKGTVANTSCASCHTTQRPDLQPGATAAAMKALLGFDHSVDGTGDCLGCHQATVAAGTYAHYLDPATGALPGGDWKGGEGYPGSFLVGSLTPPNSRNVVELTLVRSGANGLVTGMTSATVTLLNQMLHTSTVIPAAIQPGPSGAANMATCASCHATVGGVVQYAEGHYHASLTARGDPQPTSQCTDCHVNMRPAGIVEPAAAGDLQPMDHHALFVAPASVGGVTASGAADLDCSVCHASPGSTWSDGRFHAVIGAAVPRDCVACHYPLMADGARADVTNGTRYRMAHGSAQVTLQACATCHAGALASAGTTSATAWSPGALHASVPAQPAACVDCHAPTRPAAATASTVTYALSQGATATNGVQWMNHASAAATGRDCAACHAGDARSSGAAWSRSVLLHAAAPAPATCTECHGLGNGSTTAGTNNNMPAGLTSSRTVSSAGSDPATGVPAGTLDQISHADVNVTRHDCRFCHTQVGVSSVAGVAGKEWAQASFHASFSAASPLVLDGSTGRCSNCHLNVKPTAAFTAYDHGALTGAAGSQDCSACHAWPGKGGPGAPNWLGASAMPQYITVGGFTVPAPPATSPFTQGGVANLPHPTSSSTCSSCHPGGTGGKGAIGYDHASPLVTTSCNACHEAGTNLLGTPWNGATTAASGAGDSRPFTLTSVVARRGTSTDTCNVTYARHFYPVDCKECHKVPAGNGLVTTGTAYTNAWIFPHTESKMSNPSTCNMCHNVPSCPK